MSNSSGEAGAGTPTLPSTPPQSPANNNVNLAILYGRKSDGEIPSSSSPPPTHHVDYSHSFTLEFKLIRDLIITGPGLWALVLRFKKNSVGIDVCQNPNQHS